MRDRFWIGIFRYLGVLFAVGNVWTIAAIEHLDAIAKISDILFGFGL